MTTSRETTTTFVERHIGDGAMGEVYELIGHKPPAVIKYMLCGSDKRLKFFKNECEALKKIYHVNVVRLYRYTEEGIKVGIVMEYCQKGSLNGVILDSTITYSMNTVLTWGIQLFDAIDHMYQKHKLVHRDIKPDNIFVTNEYQLKIGDFGLVKVVSDGTVTGTFAGTQRYMSPPDLKDEEDGAKPDVYEQIRKADVLNSHRNDVYSLGLVMWEIIERRTIFTGYEMPNYEVSGMFFDRDRLLIDITLKRVTEIESPECQSEIQTIILSCTNFQRIHRPTASQVLDFITQTQKASQFISSLPFMPTEDKNQKKLMKPIGFDDRKECVMVESEERKYEKRFEEREAWTFENITRIMRDKLGTLNSAEREKFFKEAPNIVTRLKEETQTFKDARYVIGEIVWIEERKGNLHQKNIYEIFELFVLGDFHEQLRQENDAFERLKSHEEIWISSFGNWRGCEYSINSLKGIKREKYTTNFYFRCFISQLTGEGWIHIGFIKSPNPPFRKENQFVSEDLRLWKEIPGKWVDNARAEIRSYEIKNEDKKDDFLDFSHYKQIPFARIIATLEKQRKRMEMIIKFNLKYLIPIEDSEKNNVPFNIESVLQESSAYRRFYGPQPFPHYVFQLRNPPRPICQKNHSGKCQMDGFRKLKEWTNLPKELHIPVCDKATENEVWLLEGYRTCIRADRDRFFGSTGGIPFLILLDHPNNYANGERIPGLDSKRKLHNIDVAVLREYFEKSKLKERVYALIKIDGYFNPDIRPGWTDIRLIDYRGNPETEWLEFNELEEERKRKKVSCSLS